MKIYHIILLTYMTGLLLSTPAFGQELEASPPETKQHRMNEHFTTADTNQDGVLSLTEAQAGMPRVAVMFAAIDINSDQQVSQEELKLFHQNMRAAHEAERIDHFIEKDTNADGYLDGEELATAPQHVQNHLLSLDKDGDNKISQEEFLNARPPHGHAPHPAHQ